MDARCHAMRLHCDAHVITRRSLNPLLACRYSELKSRSFQGLLLKDAQHVVASVATCLKLCSRLGIVHADLKPENVLLVDDSSFDVRVIDFGSACFSHGKVHTYVQSRYYRAPEIVLGMGCVNALQPFK